ncbi:hypothetical protein V7201_03495 [Bacillus sp. JJ1122]
MARLLCVGVTFSAENGNSPVRLSNSPVEPSISPVDSNISPVEKVLETTAMFNIAAANR